jgi:hypothetical protein
MQSSIVEPKLITEAISKLERLCLVELRRTFYACDPMT